MTTIALGVVQPLSKVSPPSNTIKIVATYSSTLRKGANGSLTRSVLTLEEVASGLESLQHTLHLDVNLASCTTRCQKFKSNFAWFISYDPAKFDASVLYGKAFKVKDKSGLNKHCLIFNPNEEVKEEKTVTYRVCNVPNSSCNTYIRTFFTRVAPGAQIIEFKEELNKIKGYEHTLSGNVIVKLKYNRSDESKIRIPTGLTVIAGLEVVIQRAGVPLGCFACNQYGHSAGKCPLREVKCSKCGKLGHEGKCYLARPIENALDFPEVESLEFEEPATVPKPKAPPRDNKAKPSSTRTKPTSEVAPAPSKPSKKGPKPLASANNAAPGPQQSRQTRSNSLTDLPSNDLRKQLIKSLIEKRKLQRQDSRRTSRSDQVEDDDEYDSAEDSSLLNHGIVMDDEMEQEETITT